MTPTVVQAIMLNAGVDVLAHQLAVVGQQEHEDEDERQQHAVDHLRQHQDVDERQPGNQQHAGAGDDQQRVQPVEHRRLVELLVEARLEAKAFADRVRRRNRQDGRGEERRVEQPGGEERYAYSPASGRSACAASAAFSMLWRPLECSVAAHATMMNHATTTAEDAADDDIQARRPYCRTVMPFSTIDACR